MKNISFLFLLFLLVHPLVRAQSFFFGADLSYVNEMEDCGVVYRENGQAGDPYSIFAGNGCNLVRLRLWHTPSWYDSLNSGRRYSDLADVRRSIRRAKEAGMQVLLDFHLSDIWADPSRQIAPAAWQAVAGNLPVLQDSLSRYISHVLLGLHQENLLPEMVQIGNETNRGILLPREVDAAGWSLDWPRNRALFNTAIQAVRSIERQTGKRIQIALHVAAPAESYYLMKGFWENGVRDFDIIGLSYYWAWHKPTTIAAAGDTVAALRRRYPGKEVMIFETAYIWTTQNQDNAANIINEVHPAYAPASPENQRRWMVHLTQQVIDKGGKGVIYWEPAWVSSPCRTLWGQGSHQEHATFFDFSQELMPNGGMGWMSHNYSGLVSRKTATGFSPFRVFPDSNHQVLLLDMASPQGKLEVRLLDAFGKRILSRKISAPGFIQIPLPSLPPGVYILLIYDGKKLLAREAVYINQR